MLAGTQRTTLVGFGTEAGLFQRAGIPTVVCGPGLIDQADYAGAIADAERKAEEAAAAERDAMARQTAAGRTGAKVSLRTFVSARIVDYDAALAALKDRQEVREVIQSLANRAVNIWLDLPGIERVEEQRAV